MSDIRDIEILAIILARGGSKGIPGKNIKQLKGKPLIAYTIEAAKKSKYLDRIILSTDDQEIAKVAKKYGAEVPFMRPEELARDDSPSIDAIIHAINHLKEKEGYRPDYIMLLQPTSPLRSVKDINKAIEKLIELKADSVVSVSKAEKHPYWMMEIVDNKLKPFDAEGIKITRRQDLPNIYDINGAIYIGKTELTLKKKTLWKDEEILTVPYIMPEERSVDIDNMIDWKLVELLLEEEKDD